MAEAGRMTRWYVSKARVAVRVRWRLGAGNHRQEAERDAFCVNHHVQWWRGLNRPSVLSCSPLLQPLLLSLVLPSGGLH
jgi:hypothetical protein